MPGKKLLVCSNFALETKQIIESCGFSHVEIETFPSCCSVVEDSVIASVDGNPVINNGETITILTDSCPKGILTYIESRGYDCSGVSRVKVCPILFLNEALVHHYIRQGAYIITPGWLRTWRKNLEKLGFDKVMATEFFADCIKKIVVLDTKIDSNTEQDASDFAKYVDMKWEIIPVGLDHYRLFLSDVLKSKELVKFKEQLPEMIARANLLSADYAMSFDLLVSLVNEQSFDAVIEKLLDFFMLLFAPGNIIFIPSISQEQRKIRTIPRNLEYSNEEIQIFVNKLESFRGNFEWTKDNTGFRFLIKHKKEIFGMVEIDRLAFPENKEHYLNIALTISDICGLALNNARIYSRLNSTMEILNLNLNEKEKIERHLKTINKELEDFSYTVSHDLKNPLNFIKGYLLYIKEEPALFNSLFNKIIERIDSSLYFINHLLTLSRAGKIIQEIETIPLSSLIRIIFDNIKITSSNIKLVMEKDLPYIEGDPERIGHVLTNIIQNFVQNRDPDKIEHILEVTHSVEKDILKVIFKDNGIGIKKELQKRLFEPGYTLREEGTGFGLSIVKKIMEAHGGLIWIESEGEKMGTRVCLEFPLMK